MAYRGTEGIRVKPSELLNPLKPDSREGMVDTYIGDLTPMGAGYPQFEANRELIKRNAAALGKAVMTGHSLGGGLAQIVTARLPQYTKACITFAAPGISVADATSLKNKHIPTTHHRTENDVVPVGNNIAAPGTVITYERYNRAPDGQSWNPEHNPGTTHNNMPLHGLLNFQKPGTLSPLEQAVLTKGAAGPKGAGEAQSISVVSAIFPTTRDNVRHGGTQALGRLVPLVPRLTKNVFYANLGYNLLVEYVEGEVAKLDPAKLTKAQVNERLLALTAQIQDKATLPLTASALDLYVGMGVSNWEAENTPSRQGLKVGKQIAVSPQDRDAVGRQVFDLWSAWWPAR